MPGAASLAKGVRCPFWNYTDGSKRIVCESGFEASYVGVLFAYPDACRRYKREMCSGQYDNCPLYQGLMATKYREEE